MNRGQIYLCDFGQPAGHEPGWCRPALVVSPPAINRFGCPVVLPITRTARGYATHVELDGVLPTVGFIQCELIRAVSADRLVRLVGTAPDAALRQVGGILKRLLGL